MMGGGTFRERANLLFSRFDDDLNNTISDEKFEKLLKTMLKIALKYTPFLGVGEGDPRMVTQEIMDHYIDSLKT